MPSNSTTLLSAPTTISSTTNGPLTSAALSTAALNWTYTFESQSNAAESCSSVMRSLASVVPAVACPTYSEKPNATPDCYTYTSYAFPEPFLPPRPCCDTCSIQASRVQVNFWAPDPTVTTAPGTPYTLVSDGYTYTSPSVYVVYSEVYAQGECYEYGGPIGNNVSAATVAYAPDALSTAPCYEEGDGGFRGWRTIDYEEWFNPPPNSIATQHSGCIVLGTQTLSDPGGTDLIASPQFSLPQDISTLQPVWEQHNCKPWRYGALDPPRVLTKASAMGPDPSTQATSATPAAKPSSPIVTPTITPAPDKISTATSEDPKTVSSDPDLVPGSSLGNIDPSAPASQPSQSASEGPAQVNADPDSSLDPPQTIVAPNDPLLVPSPTKQDQSPDPELAPSAVGDPPSTPQTAANPVLTYGSATIPYHVDSLSNLIIDSQTARVDGPAISVSGVQISLGASANSIIVDGTEIPVNKPAPTPAPIFAIGDELVTADSASQYIVQGQTLIPGGPAMTVSSTPISLASSAAHVVIGSHTIPLMDPSAAAAPVLTVGDQVITVDSNSQYFVHGQTLVPGAPAVTLSGTPVSLAPSATQVVIGGSTIPIQAASIPTPATITFDGQIITANSASQYIIGSQTIRPGAPAVTISGTPISIPAGSQSMITVGSQVYPYLVNSAGDIVVASQTLTPGGSPVTLGGETISEALDASDIVIASASSTMTEGLGQIIVGALGRTAEASGSVVANASQSGVMFTGEASRGTDGRRILWPIVVATLFSCLVFLR